MYSFFWNSYRKRLLHARCFVMPYITGRTRMVSDLQLLGCVYTIPDSFGLASNAGVFRGARISSLPTNDCSTKNNIPFPSLANHIVLSNFWKVDLDLRVTQ